jgi:hypothetical protein
MDGEDLMGRFVAGADRSQMTFLPECLDDWVGDDNPVHVVEAFVEALDAEPWAPLHLNVTVVGGIVDVWGFAHSSAEKTATRVAVEEIPGVKAVNDNLSIMPSVAYGG